MKTILASVFLFGSFLIASATFAQGIFTFCKNVDDNVYPVEPVTEITSDTPLYFHFQNETPIGTEGGNNITIGWVIHTVGDDGLDNGFVNEYFTYFEPGCRRFCTTDLFYFPASGKYRVYAINWDDRQLNQHTGNLTKFYAKNEITVK